MIETFLNDFSLAANAMGLQMASDVFRWVSLIVHYRTRLYLPYLSDVLSASLSVFANHNVKWSPHLPKLSLIHHDRYCWHLEE